MKKTKAIGLEELKEVRSYMKRNSGQMQLRIIHDELLALIKSGASISAMYKYLIANNKFTGCYDSFVKDLREYIGQKKYHEIRGSWKKNRVNKRSQNKGEKNAKTE